MQSALFRRMRISSPGQMWRHLTENRILSPTAHGKPHSVPVTPPSSHAKAHSVPDGSRKTALCPRHPSVISRKSAFYVCSSPKDAFCAQAVTQSASFRETLQPECAFPYGTGCRMRFSVECAFPYLGKRRAISRKSAFCVRCLTEKRILHEAVRETPRTYGNNLAQAMATPKHSAAMT